MNFFSDNLFYIIYILPHICSVHKYMFTNIYKTVNIKQLHNNKRNNNILYIVLFSLLRNNIQVIFNLVYFLIYNSKFIYTKFI